MKKRIVTDVVFATSAMHKQAMAAAVVWYEAYGTNGQFFHNLGCWQGQDFAGGFWLMHNCLFIASPRWDQNKC
jgi:hypothetical protein